MHVIRRVSAPFTGTSALTFVRSLTTGNNNGGGGGSSSKARGLPNDDYFATIHHISNIVRRDIYMERTLNKMHISKIVNSELVYRVLRSCCNCGVESFRFFNWARTNHPNYDPTTVEFEELLKILAQNRNWETMWKVAETMKGHNFAISPSIVSFIIEQYGKHGLIDQAVDLFNGLKNFNCPQTTEVYNSLLFALCEGKNFQGAYALIRRMIRKGYLESALGLVKKMTKEGFVPDVGTFNCLAEALCNSGQVDFCINLFLDVCRLGFCPDTDTYKIMITVTSKIGKVDEAFKILHRSIEDGHRPFPSLYAPILKALCRGGQFDDAFSFFADMKVKGHPPNRPVYTMMMKMCGRAGRFVEAANYLVEMTELNLLPMPQSFDMVSDGLKNCGKHDLAKRIEQLEISLRGI